jgi:hypothetical protein
MSFIVSIHADFKPVLSPYIKVLPIWTILYTCNNRMESN